MRIPISLTSKGIEESKEIEEIRSLATEKVDKMSKFLGDGSSCSISVSIPHKSMSVGNDYDVRVLMESPIGTTSIRRRGHDAVATTRQAFEVLFNRLADKTHRKHRKRPHGEQLAF